MKLPEIMSITERVVTNIMTYQVWTAAGVSGSSIIHIFINELDDLRD